MPEISLIIRAFNEEKHLPALFDALDAQDFQDFETVVVDSGSFDRTRDIAAERADRLVRLSPHDFTFGHSLNVGIKNSTGRFIAILSAHTLPCDSKWLGALVSPLREEKTAMVYGRQRGGKDSKFSESADFERTFGTQRKVLAPPDFFANNANSAVRRDLWEKHAFDETLPGLEDAEWAKFWMERGFSVVYEPAAALYHIHDETWAQVRRRYYREGQSGKWIGVRHRRDLARDAANELRCAFEDMVEAAKTARWTKFPEIARYRLEKLRGTVQGVWDGSLMDNPHRREEMLFDRTYKAVVIRGAGRAALESIQRQELAPSEVLVRVAYQGVCATDLEILDGRLGYYKSGLASYPIVPGHEFSGIVASVGARVTELKEGDRVVVECIQGCGECEQCKKGNAIGCTERKEVGVIGRDGGYAEYMVTPSRFVHVIPALVPLKAACLVEPVAVVLKGLRRLERVWGVSLKPRTCAIIGAGPIGHLAARVLAERGQSVTVFDRNPGRLKHFSGTAVETRRKMEDLSPFEFLIEATGDPEALDAMLHGSRPGATILLLGLPYARRDFNFEAIVGYDKTVVGSVGSGPEDFDEALVTLPKLDTSAFFEKVLPLAEFAKGWETARAGTHLKVILRADPGGSAR